MKTQPNPYKSTMHMRVFSCIFILLLNSAFYLSFGQEHEESIQVPLIGEGENEYTIYYNDGTTDYQKNEYSINLNFILEVSNPVSHPGDDDLIIYQINSIGGNLDILATITDNLQLMSYGIDYSKGYYLSGWNGEVEYSIQNNCIERIQFSIPREDLPRDRTVIIYENDSVKVYYDFDSPIIDHVMIIPASAALNGIFLQIIETENTELVKYVGYDLEGKSLAGEGYTGHIPFNKRLFFPVFNTQGGRYALINHFENEIGGIIITSDFNNELKLFDESKKQIGHMPYEYDYYKNKDHVRNAILILHNDNEICKQDGETVFPYNQIMKDKYKGWVYYNIGEYSVSMLIPPLNKFPKYHTVEPILLLHGLNGKYMYSKWKYFPNPTKGELAKPSSEDVSYWYTTPRILNENYNFHTWQMYYPNNDAAITVSECLKFDLAYLKSLYQQKINLVTHSYGGIITRQYITKFSKDAQDNLRKVLFMTPPFYGSFAANRAYENITGTGTLSKFDGIDPYALCYRDASLGSEVTKNYWDKPFPDLDKNLNTYDDYFVILGATSKNYTTEIIHEEAKKHSDGLVAISSASLLDMGIGFASIFGNHDDGVHSQSNHPGQTNIGSPTFIPNIIYNYFKVSYDNFLDSLLINDTIKAIVKQDKSVYKPANKELMDLETTTGENYQRSLILFEIINHPFPNNLVEEINASYNYFTKTLILSSSKRKINGQPLREFNIGVFKRNSITGVYYFHEDYSFDHINPSKISDGCAIDILSGINKIKLYSGGQLYSYTKEVELDYCQSFFITINWDDINNEWAQNGNSAIKTQVTNSPQVRAALSDTIDFFVDNQASQTTFLLSPAQTASDSLSKYLLQPDGEIYDDTEWLLDTLSNLYSVTIDDPLPGQWQLWANDTLINDTLWYQAQALYYSNIILYNTNEQQTALNDDYYITANLRLPDKSISSEIELIARITTPNGMLHELDLGTHQLENDTSYLYSVPFNLDTVGVYSLEIECVGIYDGYRFERAISSQIEVIDQAPKLNIPDIYLDRLTWYKEIDLVEQIFCQGCDPYSYSFSYNILNDNNLYINIDTLSKVFITSNSADTIASSVEFLLLDNEDIICRDTILIYNYLPDLEVANLQLGNSTFEAGDTVAITIDILNRGKSNTNRTCKVGVFLSKDSLYDQSDIMLSNYPLKLFLPGESLTLSENLPIPGGISFKYPNFLVVADIDSLVYESDKQNNIVCRQVDFIPQTNFVMKIIVDKESGELIFTDPNQYSPSSVSYNGYCVSSVPWWNDYYIWAYAPGSGLPIWVNYQFNIDNYENLDSVQVMFQAHGTTSGGVFYSYLYQQINNFVTCSGDQQLINAADWTTYGLMLDNTFFQDGNNEIKIGSSTSSQTYVALNGIAVELYYSQDSSEVIIETSTHTINSDDIQVYPNPANNTLYVEGLTEKARVMMYDLHGKLLYIKKQSNNQFDISQLQPGLYLLKIETSKGLTIEQIVKR